MKTTVNHKINVIISEPKIEIPLSAIPLIANITILLCITCYNAGKNKKNKF